MNTWHELLRDKLKLDWMLPSTKAIPFGLTGVDGSAWQCDRLEKIADAHWQLLAHTESGLQATWEVQFFEDTRALECWGAVRHCGRETIKGITECLTLDTALTFRREFGQPWVRSVNGVRFIPTFFPPHDFALVDRQLVDTLQDDYPLTLTGIDDGRSSGENLPCVIVCSERQQQGMSLFLEWSGLWRIGLKSRRHGSGLRELDVAAGLRGLRLDLKPGQSLPLPRLLVTAFDGNLEAGGNSLRRHIRRYITPSLDGEEVLPPLSFNHYFAFENDFTADLLKPAVEACAKAGLEYFCVDAGWFKGDFRTGIGNWDVVDENKFPDGIKPFADFVQATGMKYGLWFEPEWAHKDSKLYRDRPDWFIPSPAFNKLQTPYNLTLVSFFGPDFHLMNFGLADVQKWWVDRIKRAYDEWDLRWIRWDFNQAPRPNWDHGIADGEIGWRQIEHITGLYHTLDQIIEACPALFIEQCAGGGHRIDLGTVRRGHSFWMNDHTKHSDIVRALQHGLNSVLPGNYANTNLCQGRHDFTEYDFLSHSCGGFGYSGRLWEAPENDFKRYKTAVARFKSIRHLLLGDYTRETGQPTSATEYAKVEFSDGRESVTMEYNMPGQPRSAQCKLRSL